MPGSGSLTSCFLRPHWVPGGDSNPLAGQACSLLAELLMDIVACFSCFVVYSKESLYFRQSLFLERGDINTNRCRARYGAELNHKPLE